jgi:hypothetical protein
MTSDAPEPAPWAKAGQVYFAKATKPYLAAESAVSGGYHAFVNSGQQRPLGHGRGRPGAGGRVEPDRGLRATCRRRSTWLPWPMGDLDGGGIGSQCPPKSTATEANDVEITEFLAVPLASIRDENLDGVFDAGQPQLWSVVDGNTNDANYNIRRFFLDEMAGESRSHHLHPPDQRPRRHQRGVGGRAVLQPEPPRLRRAAGRRGSGCGHHVERDHLLPRLRHERQRQRPLHGDPAGHQVRRLPHQRPLQDQRGAATTTPTTACAATARWW